MGALVHEMAALVTEIAALLPAWANNRGLLRLANPKRPQSDQPRRLHKMDNHAKQIEAITSETGYTCLFNLYLGLWQRLEAGEAAGKLDEGDGGVAKATGRVDEGSAAVGVCCAADVVGGVTDDDGVGAAGNDSTPLAGNGSEGHVNFGGGDSDLGAPLGDALAQVSKGVAGKDLSSVGKDDRSGATVAGGGKDGRRDVGAVVVEAGVDAVVTGDAGGGDRTGSDEGRQRIPYG